MNPAVSVIIPIYNGEEYLSNTFTYLEEQTFQDFEVIFVDDCSTDNTTRMIKGYIEGVERKVFLIQLEKNSGCGAARNRGIENAAGEYIICLDADDYYHKNLLERMYREVVRTESDVAVCASNVIDCETGVSRLFGQWKRLGEVMTEDCLVIDKPVEMQNITDLIDYVAWSKMLRREYFLEQQLWFPRMKYYEDISYAFSSLLCAERVVFIKEPLIDYYKNSLHGMTSWSIPKEFYMVDAFYLVIKKVQKRWELNYYFPLMQRALNNLGAIYFSETILYKDKQIIMSKFRKRLYDEWNLDLWEKRLKLNKDGARFVLEMRDDREGIFEQGALLQNDYIGICQMSDPLKNEEISVVNEIIEYFSDKGINIIGYKENFPQQLVESDVVKRANFLNMLFENTEARYIFDVSGGDLANEILPLLDYEMIGKSKGIFVGYSDLTCIINAIYAKTGKASILYRINNLVKDCSGKQKERFLNTFIYGNTELFEFGYRFLQGKKMKGTIIGGNIRCFLKLLGTEYMPEPEGKILFLESLDDGLYHIRALVAQLKQSGYINKIRGLIIGSWGKWEMDEAGAIDRYILEQVPVEMPVVKTREIGHGYLSKALWNGKEIELKEKEE